MGYSPLLAFDIQYIDAKHLDNVLNKFSQNRYQLLSSARLEGNHKQSYKYTLYNTSQHRIILIISEGSASRVHLNRIFNNSTIYEFETQDQKMDISLERDKWTLYNDQISRTFGFTFLVEDDIVEAVRTNMGFNYRRIEATLMSKNLEDNLLTIQRICGLCSNAHHFAYVNLVEEIFGISSDVKEVHLLIRMIVAELERASNHLLWLSISTYEAGFRSLFSIFGSMRSEIEEILTKFNDTFRPVFTLGGCEVNDDVDFQTIFLRLESFLSNFSTMQSHAEWDKFFDITKDVNLISSTNAFELGAVGSVGRASNIQRDARHDFPYALYKFYETRQPAKLKGDLYSIFLVRLKEIEHSGKLVINMLNEVSSMQRSKTKLSLSESNPDTEFYTSIVEAPGGYLEYTGRISEKRRLTDLHINVPTISNFQSMIQRFIGSQLQYIPLSLKGIEMGLDPSNTIIFKEVSSEKEKRISGSTLNKRVQESFKNAKRLEFADL